MSNLPPGCTIRDIEEAAGGMGATCDVCGVYVDQCQCPECPVCGKVGDQWCYADHGMVVKRA
jgi:hypothetical protein